MGKNLVRKTFYVSGSWTAPAGVNSVRATVTAELYPQIVPNGGIAVGDCRAYAFGGNTDGQQGNFGPSAQSSPVAIVGPSSWRQLAGWTLASCSMHGISLAGDLYGWGYNVNGQLGDGTVTARSTPTLVSGSLKWKQVDGAVSQTIGITIDNKAYAFGANVSGQLGDGTVVAKSTPTLVLGGKTWRQVAMGSGFAGGSVPGHAAGITEAGDLYMWGSNVSGQLGLGDVTPRSSPVLVLGSKKWTRVYLGEKHTLALSEDGDLYTWGLNANGQLGLGDVTPRSSPVLITSSNKWLAIAVGNSHCAATNVQGQLYAWGLNANGQLGDTTVIPKSSPTLVVTGDRYMQIAAGLAQTTALNYGANLWSWGQNTSGELGIGTVVPRSSPVLVLGGLSWQTGVRAQVADQNIKVVPGTTYSIIFDNTITFAYRALYQDLNSNGSLPCRVTLEYWT